jgi:hypothetical protein
LTSGEAYINFTLMMKLFRHIKSHRVLGYIFPAIWLAVVLASVQPVQAAIGCLADKTLRYVRPAKHHACCEDAASCGCELNQDDSANAPEQTPALAPSQSNVLSKDTILFAEPSYLPLAERQTRDDTNALARGSSVSIYLKTLNLLC